jgi:dihydropteroate synthase
VLLDVFDYLAARLEACGDAGIPPQRIAIDPGLGFAKTADHNLTILGHLALLHGLGCPLMIGASRKSFIGRLSGGAPAGERLGGSLAAALAAVGRGAQLVRVHDVRETAQALTIWQAIAAHPEPEPSPGTVPGSAS